MTRPADSNVNAKRVADEATGADDPLPADLEAAWAEWSKSIKNVDERTRTLLRAAFEAGYSVSAPVSSGSASSSSE
jgi:hypothetical protein